MINDSDVIEIIVTSVSASVALATAAASFGESALAELAVVCV